MESLPVIGVFAQIASSLFSIGSSLFGGGGFDMPSVQTFQIPQQDLAMLNNQIQANAQLSDQARSAAQEALSQYQKGELSSAYSGAYQQQYNDQLQAIKSQLAGQGFTENSTQYTNAMQQFQVWASNLKGQMLQKQLSDSLQMAGLDQEAIKSLQTSWQAQTGVTSANNQAALTQGQLQLGEQQYNTTRNNQIGSAIGSLGTSIGSIGDLLGSKTKSTGNIDDSSMKIRNLIPMSA